MARLGVLAMDHYFDQDLRSLEADPRVDVRRFPYQRLRRAALRMIGSAVATGLQAYNRPEVADARARYARWLNREVRRLYLERSFDVIVLPSDTFFYVRTLPQAAHALGIPVVVVQKETTISHDTMTQHSLEMREQARFISDFMTVCSDLQREFWMRAGADGDLISVTGQPRFDAYAEPRPRAVSQRKRVLFLSYFLDAYVPGVGRGRGLRTWEPLRTATESALIDAARRGTCDLVVKCHPQQPHRAEVARYARLAGTAWNVGVSVADVDADTRDLILASDVVVGFQTTALYEAVAARKRTIYAAWGAEYQRYRSGLIPFHTAPQSCLNHADSATSLSAMLDDDRTPERAQCASWYEQAIGPIDGHATDRVVERLATVAAAWPATDERRALERGRRRFAVSLLARSVAAATLWTAAMPVAVVAGERRRVGVRLRRAHEARSMAMASLHRENR
jgi:hypothetical protein